MPDLNVRGFFSFSLQEQALDVLFDGIAPRTYRGSNLLRGPHFRCLGSVESQAIHAKKSAPSTEGQCVSCW